MCDFFDDFDDDFDESESVDDDSFEDSLEGEMGEPFTDNAELEDKPDQTESQDDYLNVDPFFIGGAMGFGYSEGLKEREKKRRKRLGANDSD
jgi:hypothetical protein